MTAVVALNKNVNLIKNDAMLRRYTLALSKMLEEEGLNEIMINGPHKIFIEKNGIIEAYEDTNLDFTYDNIKRISHLISTTTNQTLNEKNPIISAKMPDGERVQVVIPPACEEGNIIITIRKPGSLVFSLKEQYDNGAFDHIKKTTDKFISPDDIKLNELYEDCNFYEFIKLAVKARKNIIVSGETGSGKTTFNNSLIQAIPNHHRIVTIENVREVVISQPNHVALLFSEGNQGRANVDVHKLVKTCLRLNPTRILLSELLGEEAYDFLNAINTGHNGAMTSIHANSASDVFNRLVTMIKKSRAGNDMRRDEIISMCKSIIDIVIHYEKCDKTGRRFLSEIYYEKRN
jgi:type IV secretion system protein VirB11